MSANHYNNIGSNKPNNSVYKNLLLLSVIFAFSVGLTVGILIRIIPKQLPTTTTKDNSTTSAIKTIFLNNSYAYQTVSFVHQNKRNTNKIEYNEQNRETIDNQLNIDDYIENGVYWGNKIESHLPTGYRNDNHNTWARYVGNNAVAIRLEIGCGRMQNRLVTFKDGKKCCVRYRQNTDQIQGELFSFYLAQILKLPNLAPSAVSLVDLSTPMWRGVRDDIAAAQWNSNKPIVLTKYIPDLIPAEIPTIFKPTEKHLNKIDVANITGGDNSDLTIKRLVELAQWSDLIIFDYLTANLDRIVNNLYNYQWNANIMDAPAHNLARKSDSDLLIFLDNESGLLHGYRLLKKYEIYHSILLENLCLFRKSTADVVKQLKIDGNVGRLMRDMFERRNGAAVKDILPTLPEKSVKILNERIDKVFNQIVKCESMFSDDNSLT